MRMNIGNVTITGFVNLVSDDGKRLIVGTGSFMAKSGEKVYKESVTVFLDDKFDGKTPAKGDYVAVRGDLSITPRKDDAEKLSAAMNVRFANQVEEQEAPVSKKAAVTEDI